MVKFSIYLNRPVYIMIDELNCGEGMSIGREMDALSGEAIQSKVWRIPLK